MMMDVLNKYKQRKVKGFTLIEFLIYSGIVVFVIMALTLAGINILHGRARVISMEEINRNANFSLNKISYLIRSLQEINSASGNSLSLEMYPPVENPTEIFLNEENGAIMIARGGEEGEKITTRFVTVSSLNFEEISSEGVRIDATFDFYNPTGRTEYEMSRDFKITETLRK